MAVSVKIKRVTDPLNEEAKARLTHGNFSSDSEHSADYGNAVDSPGLSFLVNGFLEHQETGDVDRAHESDLEGGGVASDLDAKDSAEDVVKRILSQKSDPFKNLLTFHVSKAVALLESKNLDKSDLRGNVMALLRGVGHNAAVCKAKWETSGGLTGGDYEYIDVIPSDSPNDRYLVDLDFAAEFEIARPTQQYSRLFRLLPVIFVGREEELKLIVKATSEAMRRSMKTKELSFPPWRKNRYMQNKWFGSYRRTLNVVQSNQPLFTAKCLRLGFDETTAVI